MRFLTPASLALLLAATFGAGSAMAQLKAPAAPAPAPGGPPGGVVQPQVPDPLSKEFHACVQKAQDAAQQTKKQIDPATAQGCFVPETKRQEAKITAATARAGKILKPADKKRLDDTNVAWRHFRDADCAFFADPKGSAEEAAGNAQCILDRTIQRAVAMDGLATAIQQNGAGGPPAGNVPPPPDAPAPAAPAAPKK